MMNEQVPAIGHNSQAAPPLPLVQIDLSALTDGLADRYAQQQARCDAHGAAYTRFLAAYGAQGLPDAEAAGRAGDWVKHQLNPLLKDIKAGHEHEKAAPLAAGRAIDAFFGRSGDEVGAVKRGVEEALDRWRRDQAARERAALQAKAEAERAEAQRLAMLAEVQQDAGAMHSATAAEERAEELAAAASAPVVQISRARGDFGAVVGTRTTWDFEIEDITKVPAEYLLVNEQMVRAAIRGAAKRDGVPQVKIPGIRVVARTKAAVR